MEKITLGNCALVKMEVQEYDKTYECDMEDLYGQELEYVAWVEKYDNEGNIVGASMESMLIYKNGTFAYTSRGYAQECKLHEALEVILWIEEV